MSRLLNVTLTTAGANTGPFDLYQCVGPVCEVIPVANSVSLSQISTGYTVTVNDGVNMIRVVSIGPCNRTVDIYFPGITPTPTNTPTPTTSSTPTTTPTSTSTETPTSTPTTTTTAPTYGTYTLCFSAINNPASVCSCLGPSGGA